MIFIPWWSQDQRSNDSWDLSRLELESLKDQIILEACWEGEALRPTQGN